MVFENKVLKIMARQKIMKQEDGKRYTTRSFI